MFKLALLLTVVAVAAANPGVLAPIGYGTAVVPGVTSTSAYSTSIVHPTWYGTAGIYGAGYGAPYHHLGKRSIGYSAWPAASYANTVLSGYGGAWGAPAYGYGYGYAPLYPRALSVHPY